jgi:hypothetical protein
MNGPKINIGIFPPPPPHTHSLFLILYGELEKQLESLKTFRIKDFYEAKRHIPMMTPILIQ